MSQPKPARNYAGGVKRIIRITTGIVILAVCINRAKPALENGAVNEPQLIVWAILTVIALYMLKGTLKRIFGMLIAFVMILFVALGHMLTFLGFSDTFRRVSLSVGLVGMTIVFTGRPSWSLITYATGKQFKWAGKLP